jgi:predicted phage terminase large subunit-like protein
MLELDASLLEQLSKMPLTDFASALCSLDLSTEEGFQEAKALIIHRGAVDVKFYAWFFFPHYCTREFNQYHEDTFAGFKWCERNVRRARAAPRGSAKSTIATFIKPLHDTCYGLEKFILILSSTTPLANKKLKDIRAEVVSNHLLFDFFGTRFPKKKVGESEFGVIADAGVCYFVAVGKGSEVRGIRIGQYRPTKVISDDVEYSEEVYNEAIRDKTEAWYHEDVGKVGDTGTNFEFVGTILHKDALLPKLIRNPAYEGSIYKAIISWSEREDLWNEWRKLYVDWDDPNRMASAQAFYLANERELLKGTKVLWPEKETYLDHMKDMIEIGKRAFFKEKQNEPMGAQDAIFDTFHWYRETPDGCLILSNNKLIHWQELQQRCIGALDPATGKNKPKKGAEGDFASLGVGFVDRVGRLLVHYDWTKRASPSKAITEIFESRERFGFEKLAVETNLFRELLMPNIQAEKERREREKKKKIDVTFYEVVNTENKRERITTIEPKVTHGKILFNVALSQTLRTQFEDFPRNDHDDAPDMVHMLWTLANGGYDARAISANPYAGR